MKLKCKKINGVNKHTCTCEQKIAYNYAFSCRDVYKRRVAECKTEIQKSEVFQDIIDFVIKDLSSRPEMSKYNIDAVTIAFRQGFLNYVDNFFIANSYEKIGNVFCLPYEII